MISIYLDFLLDGWFGKHCQYHIEESLDEDIQIQFSQKTSFTDWEVSLQSAPLTCYMCIYRCNSTICLDWRQICDNHRDCENGVDEPTIECLQLEINECDPVEEYRCRNGMCIPRMFFVDFNYDCIDQSDEQAQLDKLTLNDDCFFKPDMYCEELSYLPNYFSCGDGQFVYLPSSKSNGCHSGRNRLYNENLRSFNSSHLSYNCWFIMTCLTYSDLRLCEWLDCSPFNDRDCLDAYRQMRRHCGNSFFFQAHYNPLYPFAQHFYHDIFYDNDGLWMFPNYVCYNHDLCPNFPCDSSCLVLDNKNLTCIKKDLNFDWPQRRKALNSIFAACSMITPFVVKDTSSLFYCNSTRKFISKYRINDGYMDCIYDDEDTNNKFIALSNDEFKDKNLTYPCGDLKLIDRFKCLTTEQCIPRTMLGRNLSLCNDRTDHLFIGQCKKSSDLACQFIRGDNNYPPVYYLFQENCNNNAKLRYFSSGIETDETSCEEWPSAYRQRYERCNDVWDEPNGQDELNCPGTTMTYIREKVGCNSTQHYCALDDGKNLGCLDKTKAGNNHIDCLFNTDERTTDDCIRNGEFRCSNGRCLNEVNFCKIDSSCPFSMELCIYQNFIYGEFTCLDGKIISETKLCDNIIDCPEQGEDEWFCDMYYEKKVLQFSLDLADSFASDFSSSDHQSFHHSLITKDNYEIINLHRSTHDSQVMIS